MENNEETSYFRAVVRDAVQELKQTGCATVFSREQVDAIQENFTQKLEVKLEDDFYKIIYVAK